MSWSQLGRSPVDTDRFYMIALNGLELHMFDSEFLDEQLDEQLNYSLRT